MKIAIQAADLDAARIDGTRVYLANLLRLFGALETRDQFLLYHKKTFNPALAPPVFPNYIFREKNFPLFWTQTRFAFELAKSGAQKLWMPVQALPLFRSAGMETIVTMHDLAFKFFPTMFPAKDLFQLNRYADYVVKRADKLIAVSEATRQDILRCYPAISEKKIRTIHHGFDGEIFSGRSNREAEEEFRREYGLSNEPYWLYVGAIQPRKDLVSLIEAFSLLKKEKPYLSDKLVLVGAPAWQAEGTLRCVKQSPVSKDIILTGTVPFVALPKFYQFASAFVFPELCSGFGIPLLEAFASGVPVVAADNPALREVGTDAALFFPPGDVAGLARELKKIRENPDLRQALVAKGRNRVTAFSWEKCARETLAYIKE